MIQRIENYFEDRPGIRRLFTIICIVLVRVIVILNTDSYYFSLLKKELSKGQERMLYYGLLVICLILIWSIDLHKRLLYIGLLSVLPALLCFGMQHIYWSHWTMELIYALFFLILILVGVRVAITLVYDKRQGQPTRNLENRAASFYCKGLLWIPLLFGLCITFVGWVKPELLVVSEETTVNVSAVPATPEKSKQQMWMDNPDKMSKLNAAVFSKLSLEEKLEVLKFIVEVEMTYLGCEGEIELVTEDTERDTVQGFYEPESGKICIQKRLLERGYVEECLDTIMHECYHLYQHQCILFMADQEEIDSELLMFRSVEQWQMEMANYQNGEGDYDTYRYQSLEDDAFDYASKWLGEIILQIPTVVDETEAAGDSGKGTWQGVEVDISWDNESMVGTEVEVSAEKLKRYDNAKDYTGDWEFLFPEYEEGAKRIAQTDSFQVYTEYSMAADGTETNEVMVRTKEDAFIRLSVDYLTLMKNSALYPSTDTRFVEKDYDQDGEAELAILFTITGTTYSVDELFVVDKDAQGQWQAYHLTNTIYQEWMDGRVDTVKEDGKIQVLLDDVAVGKVLDLSLDHYYAGGSWVYTSVPQRAEHDFELVYEYVAYLSRGLTGYFPGNAFLEKINYLGEGRWELQELSYQEMPAKNPVVVDIGN